MALSSTVSVDLSPSGLSTFRVQPSEAVSTYSRPVLGASGNLGDSPGPGKGRAGEKTRSDRIFLRRRLPTRTAGARGTARERQRRPPNRRRAKQHRARRGPRRARSRSTASCASANTPADTPARRAAPYAAPSSTCVRSSGRSSTDARICEPELAARAAAGDAADLGLDAERPQQLERVEEAVRNALEDGTGQRAAVVPQRQADEGAARVRVGVRRALAREVRREAQTLRTRRPRCRLAEEVLVRRPPERRVQPAERSRRREHDAHRVPRLRAPRGRRRGAAPAGRRGRQEARRRRRRRCRARPRAAPGGRRRHRARRRPDRPRPRPRSTRRRAGATRAGARARRAPRRSSAGPRRRTGACPTRRRRRSRARPSCAGGRSPSGAGHAGSARRRPARAGAATGASAP